jgi:hypothetical protein
MLSTAIDSCLAQRTPLGKPVPVHVIVADQGGTDKVAEVMRRYSEHPNVEHLETSARCLWENWDAAARACDTEFFMWLQDDDEIAKGIAARVIGSFDVFPKALHWQARLCAGLSGQAMAWWGTSGPMVLLDMIGHKPLQYPGEVIPPCMYLGSWAMSPAVAFRCGEQFNRALDCMPSDADLWAERTILALMGMQGPWIADPVIVGPWIHHGGNESYKQHHDQERQKLVTLEVLDDVLDHTDWRDIFEQWLLSMRNAADVMGYLKEFPAEESRHAEALKEVMRKSLSGRVEPVLEPAPTVGGQDLVWSQEALDTMRAAS